MTRMKDLVREGRNLPWPYLDTFSEKQLKGKSVKIADIVLGGIRLKDNTPGKITAGPKMKNGRSMVQVKIDNSAFPRARWIPSHTVKLNDKITESPVQPDDAKMKQQRSKVDNQIKRFVNALQKAIEMDYKNKNYSIRVPKIEAKYGRRYAKIIRVDNQKIVHCFIDRNTGDIYKAAGYNAPAKHVRGNIMKPDLGLNSVDTYGARYIKGPQFASVADILKGRI